MDNLSQSLNNIKLYLNNNIKVSYIKKIVLITLLLGDDIAYVKLFT